MLELQWNNTDFFSSEVIKNVLSIIGSVVVTYSCMITANNVNSIQISMQALYRTRLEKLSDDCALHCAITLGT